MQAVDIEVVRQARDWLAAGERIWFATVVATWGSSPRPVGSLMTCNTAGHITGSLSGGCVEEDLLEKLAAGTLAKERAQFFRYGATAEEAEKFGLPCGGELHIVIEPHGPESLAHFTDIADELAARRSVQRTVQVGNGEVSVHHLGADASATQPLRWDADAQVLTSTIGPTMQLFIIGAGMVSQYLASFALSLDYLVTVCDPRQEMIDTFPVQGVQRICDMPDDAVRAHANDAQSAIVALTHDPRIDDMGLMEALTTDAFYIGAMGSTRTSANRRLRLKALELSDADLDKLHAPIGLPIGSKTPPEIAISILAEITAVRHSVAAQAREAVAASAG